MKKILVIAAHPDDEALGCGGSLLKSKSLGHEIHLLFMTDGISARNNITPNQFERRQKGIEDALEFLSPTSYKFLKFPDNQLDTIPLLKIIQSIENFIFEVKPNVVLTHFFNDLNIDHRITAQATLTASRPGSQTFVEKILSFEVPSSTEWSLGIDSFRPDYFVDVSEFIQEKTRLLKYYGDEIKAYPHPRSFEIIRALNQVRGAIIARSFAEGFVTLRNINDAF